jgi:hypothetical protein
MQLKGYHFVTVLYFFIFLYCKRSKYEGVCRSGPIILNFSPQSIVFDKNSYFGSTIICLNLFISQN